MTTTTPRPKRGRKPAVLFCRRCGKPAMQWRTICRGCRAAENRAYYARCKVSR